jgi:hypothetical protein
MDTFTDRLAQRLAAQEIIKANSAAEVEKMQKLQGEVRDYQECVAQMRIMNGEIQREVDKLAEIVSGMPAGSAKQSQADLTQLLSDMREAFDRQTNSLRTQITALLETKSDHVTGENLRLALDTFASEKLTAVLDTFADDKISEKLQSFLDGDLTGKLDNLLDSQLSVKLDGILPKLEEAASRSDTEQNLSAQMQKMLEEITAKLDTMSQNEAGSEKLNKLIQETQEKLEEHIHKENVKVYRNVQAVIMEESTKQTEGMIDITKKVGGKAGMAAGMSITSMILSALSLGGIAYMILTQLGIL